MTEASAPAPRRRRRWYALTAGALVVFCVAAVVVAARSDPEALEPELDPAALPVGPRAPDVEADGWLNSDPLAAADLDGKVVLYDFWTYSCVNCVRTIPHIQALADRYGADGLVVIGVHSPELEFERAEENVQSAVDRLGVTYPVALDPDREIWSAFDNRYWPTRYIADRDGRVRYVREGEGAYEDTETVVRSLLGIPASAPRVGEVESSAVPFTGLVNPETYLGTRRTTGDITEGLRTYPHVDALAPMQVALTGPWNGTPEYAEAVDAGATIALAVEAKEVNLVLDPGDRAAATVEIRIDGMPVPADRRGASIEATPDGRTVVTVDRPDMYRLFASPEIEQHRLEVVVSTPGVRAYAFTFG